LHVLQVIDTTSGRQYYINPAYFMPSGKRLSLDLFLLFRNDLKDILPPWVREEFLRQADVKRHPGALNEAEYLLKGV